MSDVVTTKQYAQSAKDLKVYQKAYRMSLAIHRCSLDWPKFEQYALADQMRRASRSICANLAEGFARQQQSPAEFRRFIMMAIGSSSEVDVWIDYCLDFGYIDGETHTQWYQSYREIHRMLIGLRNQISNT